MYLLAEGDILDWFLGCFYWGDPDKSLANVLWPTGVYWGEADDKAWSRASPPHDVGVLLWTLGYIGLMVLFAWELQRRRIFLKL